MAQYSHREEQGFVAEYCSSPRGRQNQKDGQAYLCLPADPDDNNIKLNITAPITHIDGEEVTGLWHTLSFCCDYFDAPIQPQSVTHTTKFYPNTCVHCFIGQHPEAVTYAGNKRNEIKNFKLADPIHNNDLFLLAEKEMRRIEKSNENISKFKPLIKLYDRADIINDIA